jgi:hypothetical protein
VPSSRRSRISGNLASKGPQSVTFAYPAQNQFWPFEPPPRRAAITAAACGGKGMDMLPQAIEFDPDPNHSDFLQQVDRAVSLNSVVVVLLNGAGLANPGLQELLRKFDGLSPKSASVTIVWKEDPRQDWIEKAFPNFHRKKTPYFYGDVRRLPELEKALTECLSKLHREIPFAGPGPVPPSGLGPGGTSSVDPFS